MAACPSGSQESGRQSPVDGGESLWEASLLCQRLRLGAKINWFLKGEKQKSENFFTRLLHGKRELYVGNGINFNHRLRVQQSGESCTWLTFSSNADHIEFLKKLNTEPLRYLFSEGFPSSCVKSKICVLMPNFASLRLMKSPISHTTMRAFA